jgi:hypothetical protein
MADPFSDGTSLVVTIFAAGRFFETRATVVYSQPKASVGLVFCDLQPYFAGC